MSDDDRPKRTFSEMDRLRREGRGGGDRAPRRSRRDQEELEREALAQADALFAKDRGGQEGDRLARAMRDAHGTPGLAEACRAYRDGVGALPSDPELLSLFLDARDRELVVAALEALLALQQRGELEVSGRLRSQIRVLAEDFDDAIADVAEELAEAL